MEGSDETGVIQRIESSFGNCSSSSLVVNQGTNQVQLWTNAEIQNNYGRKPAVGIPPSHPHSNYRLSSTTTTVDRVLKGGYNVQGVALPPMRGHRRSSSDLQVQNSSSVEEKESRSSENEGDSSGISSNSVERRETGCVPGGVESVGRHCRSLSMDSFMGNLRLNNNGEVSTRVVPSSAQHSRSNSMDGSGAAGVFSLEFGNVQFSSEELKKIMANEKLAEVAKADPKRVKRILANRVSAARSKERKVRYIAELEYKVQTLQTEATSLSAQLTFLQRDSAELVTQNNELRFRLQAMDQQAQLRDALNEALNAEVQRLRIAAEMRGICLPQQILPNNHEFQMQLSSQHMHQSQQIQENAGSTHNQQCLNGQPAQSVKDEDS